MTLVSVLFLLQLLRIRDLTDKRFHMVRILGWSAAVCIRHCEIAKTVRYYFTMRGSTSDLVMYHIYFRLIPICQNETVIE